MTVPTPTIVPTIPTPLRVWDDGSIRVGDSRLLLEVLLDFYNQGYTAEELAENFTGTPLADIHGVITYYLQHRAEIDAYIEQVREKGARLRAELEACQAPPRVTREVLMARLQARGRKL